MGGNWTAAANWTADPTGMGAASAVVPTGVPVVILSGARINMNSNGRRAYKTTIDGLLNNVNRTGHDLGIISGTGTFRTAINTFPAGNYTAFVAAGGGTIEYVAPMTMNSRTTYNNLSIYSGSSGDVTMTATDIVVNGNLTIPTGTTLTNTTNNADITIAGNWDNNGTFSAGTGVVTFNGSTAQNIVGSNAFYGVVVNKSGTNVTLSGSATNSISNALTLTSGNIITSSTNILELGSATVSGGSANSYISGPLTKTIAASGSFVAPLGSVSASRYRPATIANTSASDTWSFEYVGHNPTTDGYSNTTMNTANIGTVSQFEYWLISRSGATSADMTLTYDVGSYVPPNVGVVANLRVARWDGTQWDLPPTSGGIFSQSGTNIAGSVSVTNMTSFSPQALASTDVNSPLPVELISFTGKIMSLGVELKWKTASEVNNDYFNIEKSRDGLKFTSISQVEGNGTTNIPHNYFFIDENINIGKTYYRLKQVDFDGKTSYSNVIVINFVGDGSVQLNVYPNPTNGNVVKIEIEGLNEDEIPVYFYDQLGKIQLMVTLKVDELSGSVKSEVPVENLSNGLYLLKFGNSPILRKLVITK